MQLRMVAVGVVAGGALLAGIGAATASSESSAPRGWPGGSSGAVSSEITTAKTLRFMAHTDQFRLVRVGRRFGPGSYFVFEETLRNAAGRVVGSDAVRCTANFTTFMCDGTAFVDGKGTITIYGAAHERGPLLFSVTGGTGRYQNARGQLEVRELPGDDSELIFHLLP